MAPSDNSTATLEDPIVDLISLNGSLVCAKLTQDMGMLPVVPQPEIFCQPLYKLSKKASNISPVNLYSLKIKAAKKLNLECSVIQIPNNDQLPYISTISGNIVQLFAIGGETTGVAIETHLGASTNLVELSWENESIGNELRGITRSAQASTNYKLTGYYSTRRGIERGEYEVFVVKSIEIAP